MSKYETIEIPFQPIGNRQCLTRAQIEDHPYLSDFVKRFCHCFEQHPVMDVFVFYPEGDSPNPVAFVGEK